MTQVTGTLVHPDGTPAAGASVSFRLAGATRAFLTASGETVLPAIPVPVDDDGVYLVDLAPNVSLNPAGTQWTRVVTGPGLAARDDLLVPVSGGPYEEEDILAEPLEPLPETEPSNEVDSAVLTVAPSAIAVDTLNLDAVAGLVVTVPDTDRPVYVEADAVIFHSVANAVGGVFIAPVGSATILNAIAQGGTRMGPAGSTGAVTSRARARLDPNTPGDYQVFVAGDAGNLTVNAQTYAPARITALAV